MTQSLSSVAYIGAIILFILSLGGLSNPETSRRGNLYGIIGMTIAVLATVFGPRVGAAGIPWIVGAVLFWFIGAHAPAAFLTNFTVFVLGCFVGYMVIWNVTPALHTPLMSVTNAISSILVIGALIQIAPSADAGDRPDQLIRWMAVVGIALTSINMFGGFAVTRRMLAMFRK